MEWKNKSSSAPLERQKQPLQPESEPSRPVSVYADAPGTFPFVTLQNNLQNCLSIIDNEVMKNYVPALQSCDALPLSDEAAGRLEQIQFFRISALVYQDDEFSVHKLATVFHALSNKPCTLVLLIQSDGQNNDFYLGVRSRDSRYSGGTMRQALEQSLLGLFPGSSTDDYLNETLQADLNRLSVGAVSSVTCIADYKQEHQSLEDKHYIQGLEKFISSMQGKAFTAVCIANNLAHQDLVETRREYERIYTLMSPFANMQYSYALNQSSSSSDSDTTGETSTDSHGVTAGINTSRTVSDARSQGTSSSRTVTDTEGRTISQGYGTSHTTGTTEGTSDSESITKTVGTHTSTSQSVSAGISAGPAGGPNASVSRSTTTGVSSSVARGQTHGTSHTDSVSDSISRTLTLGVNSSKSQGHTAGENESATQTLALGTGTQYSENSGSSHSTSYGHTKALTDTFGNSQSVTLNVQNKALIDTLKRLEKQLARLDECESVGMWDFAAYFLGESAAEAETAASMYRSLVSGNQTGLELAAVNTWTGKKQVREISRYITHFLHPVFLYDFADSDVNRRTYVDATALASTNELAIQLGLPRKSVKGLPVIEHAPFAQEVLSSTNSIPEKQEIFLGAVNHFGRETETPVSLDLESLSMHTFITGSTGSGKSNAVYQILSELLKHQVRFLVIEPAKGEYKNVFGGRRDVAVYGTNPMRTSLLRINPFSFPAEIHIYEHLDRLVEIFNVCWPMYAAMPAVLKDAMERAYVKAGWDLKKSQNKYDCRLFPGFSDVLLQIDEVMEQSQYSSDNKSDYKGALCTRLRSLTNGINGLVFTSDELSPAELFDQNVIIDLSRVGSSETKSLIMGLLVMKLQEHRMASCGGMNVPLKHVTVLEEAHNLLKRTSAEQSAEGANLLGKSVEMLSNAIAEMRTYGEGFLIADQSPGLLDMAVIRNTNTKIILRLPEYSDRELVGRAASLNDQQILELSRLNKGVAAVYQNDWLEPILCKVCKYTGHDFSFSFIPETVPKKREVKGELVHRVIAGDLLHLVDRVDREILTADLPAAAKCRLFDYINTPVSKRLDATAAVVYELFSAESAFSALSKSNFDFEQQKRFLEEHLTPPISPLPEKYRQVILYLVTYQNASLTENQSAKALLNHLIKTEERRKLL